MTQHADRFPRPRSIPWFITLPFTALVAGCAQDPDSDTASLFPVRLLPEVVSRAPDPILSERLFSESDRSDWSVVSWKSSAPELITAAGHPDVTTEDGLLLLHDPESVLVRLFEFEPDQRLRASVELDACGKFQEDGPCGGFLLVMLDRLETGESITDLLARGIPSEDGSTHQSVGKRLVRQSLEQMAHPRQRWSRPPDPDGIAGASLEFKIGAEREVYALVLPARTPPARLRSFQVAPVPDIRMRLQDTGRLLEGLGPTNLNGVLLTSALVPRDGSLTLSKPVPSGARTLSFSLGMDTQASAGSTIDWFAEVEQMQGQFLEVARGRITRSEVAGPQGFQDHSVAWPELAARTTPRIRFRVTGPTGLLVGQPMIRGPARNLRPNLLLVSLDTLRADRLGCYGYRRPTSPFIDALAASATQFQNLRGVAPYTLPTHATMFTGLMPQRHGAVRSSDRLDASRLNYLPRLLSRSGYVTAAFAAGGFLSHDFGFSAGFDRFGMLDPILPVDDDLSTATPTERRLRTIHNLEAAAHWIEEHAGERWFLFVHSFIVHEYRAPPRDRALFQVTALEAVGDDPTGYLAKADRVDELPPKEVVAHLSDRYDATIHYADRMLARFFQRLERRGLLEQTVVVIASDHGEEFLEHGGLRHSISLHGEMLNVPLIIRAPSGPPGIRVREQLSQADLTPTLLDLLGLPALEEIDGHSRAGFVRGEDRAGKPTPLYAQIRSPKSRRSSLQVGPLKIIRADTSTARRRAPGEWQLFDLDQDPGELHDLSSRFPDQLADLRRRLTEYEAFLRSRALTGSPAQISPDVLRRLDELGYK